MTLSLDYYHRFCGRTKLLSCMTPTPLESLAFSVSPCLCGEISDGDLLL